MAVADKKEILEFFTMVMRQETEGVTTNTFKAAELLGKYYGLFKGANDSECGDVIIVDDVGTDKDSKTQ